MNAIWPQNLTGIVHQYRAVCPLAGSHAVAQPDRSCNSFHRIGARPHSRPVGLDLRRQTGQGCALSGYTTERAEQGWLRGDALVTVVETADFREHHDGSDDGLSGGPMIGRVFLESEVRSAPVIVLDVRREHAPEVRLVQDDHVVEALPADRADYALNIRILPGTRRCRNDFGDADTSDAALEHGAISSGKASTTCCAAHSAVGCAVTLACRMRRRWCDSTTRTKSTRPVSVGTVKKSIEAADAR